MRVVGERCEREITSHASGELLREGALFNAEMQRIQSLLRFPQGIHRYASHEDAARHWDECQAATMAAVWQSRHGG